MAVGSSNSFDLIVLGGGTGGYSAAFRAGQLGLKVALVDDQPRLGGTCLIWGCIPTKAMLESAELYERMQHSADFGIPVSGDLRFDYATVAKRRDGIVDRLTKGVEGLAKKNKVELIRGRGTLQGGKKVLVKTLDTDGKPDGERPLDATDVILATGSRVKSLPGLDPDGERIITSDEATHSDKLPASHHRRGRRRGRRRVRQLLPRRGRRSDAARVPAARHAARGRRGIQGAGALIPSAQPEGRSRPRASIRPRSRPTRAVSA